MSSTPTRVRRSDLFDSSGSVLGTPESDPYGLFNLAISRSPPTPYENARQRQAAQRRKAKSQLASKQDKDSGVNPQLRGCPDRTVPPNGALPTVIKLSKAAGRTRKTESVPEEVSQTVKGGTTVNNIRSRQKTILPQDLGSRSRTRTTLNMKFCESVKEVPTSSATASSGRSIASERGFLVGCTSKKNPDCTSRLSASSTKVDNVKNDQMFLEEKVEDKESLSVEPETDLVAKDLDEVDDINNNGLLSQDDGITEDQSWTKHLSEVDEENHSFDHQLQNVSVDLGIEVSYPVPRKHSSMQEEIRVKPCYVLLENCNIALSRGQQNGSAIKRYRTIILSEFDVSKT